VLLPRSLAPLVLVSVFSSGCTEPTPAPSPAVGQTTERLVGGSPDQSADDAIGILDVSGDAGQCTAELIAPTVLLTAAHCVLTEQGGPLPDSTTYRFYNGPDFDSAPADGWVTIQPKNVHPNPAYDTTNSTGDVAILVLDDAYDATPIPINTQPLGNDVVGAKVRLVGYGDTTGTPGNGPDGFGVKRTLSTTVAKLKDSVVLIGKTGQQGCSGDSGGPALMQINGVETLIATDDYSDAPVNCTTGDYYQRVDLNLAFIQPFLAGAPGASQKSATSGPGASTGDDDDSTSSSSKTKHTASTTPAASYGCQAAPGATVPSPAAGAGWLLALAVALVGRRRRN
jgi:MYXO-CTERM domain-containing protein